MNVKKQLKDAQESIDNNSKDNAELLCLKVGLASKLDKIVKVDEQILGSCARMMGLRKIQSQLKQKRLMIWQRPLGQC